MSDSPLAAGLPTPAYTYAEFRALVAGLAAERRTSGPDQLPGLIRFTQQNGEHLDRACAVPLLPALVEAIRHLPRAEHWVVLAEAWCGDTAHSLPILARLAEGSAGHAKLHVLLRSDHPVVMAAHQTNGKNIIPKLIRLDASTRQELGSWGGRPAPAQALNQQLHADPAMHTSQIVRAMNDWYEADQGQTLQQELLAQLQGES
ncbi:hypothetical protein GCM10023185_19960 [Hymenobacter saemangeumensis]|uniref:Thioredoxin family protein n=1 Tax=Hymenobacter saemangeumensis TaxID=1084522 RepID=A0ABP8ICU8_9BACT